MNPVFNHPTLKLGKRSPRLDQRTLKLAKYLTPALPMPPARAGYIEKVPSWPMYLNDELGDCVIAAAAHMIEQWSAYSGTEASIYDRDVLIGYEKVGGYIPGNPDTDNGCDMLTALKYWRKTGFGGHKIQAFVAVDPTNKLEVMQAIYLFGNVYAGFALPLSAQTTTNPVPNGLPLWQFPAGGLNGDGSPGSWGGHCVPFMGYSNDSGNHPGTELITWGSVYDATWEFVKNYADEAYAVLSPDWFDKSGVSPSGLDLARLEADLIDLTAESKPKVGKKAKSKIT